MQTRRRPFTVVVSSVLLLALIAGAGVFADQPAEKEKPKVEIPAPAVEVDPKEAEAASAPQQAATVSPEAKAVIDRVDAAYGKLKRLELAGTFSADLDAAGEQRKESKTFAATFVAPNKFRHLMQDDILVGSTGDKAYAYMEQRKIYTQADAPKEKAELQRMPEPIPQIIQMQNPALMLAMVKSAAGALGETFSDIKKVEDTTLDGAAFPTLRLTLPNQMVVTMLFHPETHLLRQARTDMKPMLEQQGTPDVKSATLTVDYTTVKTDDGAAVKDEQFAWAPPQGARDLAEMAAADQGGGGEASELEGKAAPAFALKDMAGKEVSLSALKGKVVVLDLWATWCGPCRVSLPHLDKLHAEMKDKPVAVYAVNIQEEKDDVQKFIEATKLKTPVLLDGDGSVAQKYHANAIPQTVVIGKDGKVLKVMVGFNPEKSPQELKEVVEKALK